MSWVINPCVWFSSCKTHTEHCSNTKIDFRFSRYFSWRTEDKNCALNYTVNLLHIVMFIDFFMQVKILRLSNWEIIHETNGFVCLFTEKKAFQLSRTGGCYIQFWIHYLSKTLGELSNHPRSPYNVGKCLQNKNLKFLRKSFCTFRFILSKGLWVFLHQSFFKRFCGF